MHLGPPRQTTVARRHLLEQSADAPAGRDQEVEHGSPPAPEIADRTHEGTRRVQWPPSPVIVEIDYADTVIDTDDYAA